MSDNPNTDADPTAAESGIGDTEGDTPTAGEKTFTQAELDSIVNSRLKKHERALRKTFEAEKKRESMTELETARADLAARDARIAELEGEVARGERLAALAAAGVKDAKYALFVLEQNPDLVSDDGEINVEGLLEAAPILAPETPQAGPAPTTAGGSTGEKVGMTALIRQAAGRG